LQQMLVGTRTAEGALDVNEQSFDTFLPRDGAGPCPLPANATPGAGSWLIIAVTQLPAGPATVLADTSSAGSNRLIVVDDATCAVVLERGP